MCFVAIAWIVEQAGPVIVAVMQELLEFAVCYLERSEFDNDDFSVQVCCFQDFSPLCFALRMEVDANIIFGWWLCFCWTGLCFIYFLNFNAYQRHIVGFLMLIIVYNCHWSISTKKLNLGAHYGWKFALVNRAWMLLR